MATRFTWGGRGDGTDDWIKGTVALAPRRFIRLLL